MLLSADPKASYLAHKNDIDQAVRRVLESGKYILGQEVAAFEQEFARYLGAGCAIGVGSGTDAIHLALRVCCIGPGDAVITVSHTAVATVAAIELSGAAPVLVDIDPSTFTIDPNLLERAIEEYEDAGLSRVWGRLKAVIPVHLYGQPVDMPAVMDIAGRHGLYVIEDCAQSHGASIQGQKTGTWGHLSAFSFYPTKNLGALGDAGALVTNDTKLAEKAHMLREYGWRTRYISDLPGMNTRLDEIQAAVLRVRLRCLDAQNKRRVELAQLYGAHLAGASAMVLPVQGKGEHVYHQYVVRSLQRDRLKDYLLAQGVHTSIHYPVPVHLQPAYEKRIILGLGSLPHTEKACREVLSLPMHPQLDNEEVDRICVAIVAWRPDR